MRRTRATKERLHSEERRVWKNSGSEQENAENPHPPWEFHLQNRERKEALQASTTAPWLGKESRKHQNCITEAHRQTPLPDNVPLGSEQVTHSPTPNPRTQTAVVSTAGCHPALGAASRATRHLGPMCTSQAEKRPLRDSSYTVPSVFSLIIQDCPLEPEESLVWIPQLQNANATFLECHPHFLVSLTLACGT